MMDFIETIQFWLAAEDLGQYRFMELSGVGTVTLIKRFHSTSEECHFNSIQECANAIVNGIPESHWRSV